MKRFGFCAGVWLALCLLLFSGCKDTPDAFATHRAQMVGTWQMATYTDGDGKTYDFRGKAVVFDYRADGTGQKTVDGTVEYTFTYAYDGKNLYTTAHYPSGREQLMNDLCTADGDKMTVYSYDENSTVVLEKIQK